MSARRGSDIALNLVISTAVSVILIPLLILQLPEDKQDGKWGLAITMVLLAYAAPFIRDWGRRRPEEEDGREG